jgi:hypothetical protein
MERLGDLTYFIHPKPETTRWLSGAEATFGDSGTRRKGEKCAFDNQQRIALLSAAFSRIQTHFKKKAAKQNVGRPFLI